jgi:hypothetical protein
LPVLAKGPGNSIELIIAISKIVDS